MHEHWNWMAAARQEAARGLSAGGVPVGSILVYNGAILGRGHNQRVQMGSAIRHGEMDALERAGRQPAAVYQASTLYTTLSPCSMCSGAILLYKIPRVVIGENSTFMGEEALLQARGVELIVLNDPDCKQLMDTFIQLYPGVWAEDIGV